MTEAYLYVLRCNDDTLYTGYTTDITRRFKQHSNAKGAKYTRVKKRQPLKLAYVETFSNKQMAQKAEYHFKRLSRTKKEAYINDNFQRFLQLCQTNDKINAIPRDR